MTFDENNTWYEIEKINGLTVSVLYVSELLTFNVLKSIMESIKEYIRANVMKIVI